MHGLKGTLQVLLPVLQSTLLQVLQSISELRWVLLPVLQSTTGVSLSSVTAAQGPHTWK
jgi:hypothetical protein